MTNETQKALGAAMIKARDDVAAIHRMLTLYGQGHECNVAMKTCMQRAADYIGNAMANLGVTDENGQVIAGTLAELTGE